MDLPSNRSVLIVGAGPSGLMMAAQLLRNGIEPVIIDAKTQPSQNSKAIILHARSLEILRQMQLSDIAIKQGNVITELVLHKASDEIISIDLASSGEGKSPFPFVLMLEQDKTERILMDYLTANACPIYWNTNLSGIYQTDENISAKINHNGREEIFTCDWLIGADGASGTVRKELKVEFRKEDYQHKYYLADLIAPHNLGQDAVRVFLKDEGFAGIYPLQEDKVRIIGELPKTLRNRTELTFSDLKPYLVYTLGFTLQNAECAWFSVYNLSQGIAEKLRVQRCFLIGDAAHVHSPVLGQGMNTGFQDAYNLAWKLSGVLKNEYKHQILDTYSTEREAAVRFLLTTTNSLLTLSNPSKRIFQKFKNWFLPGILNRSWKNEDISEKLFDVVSQIGINYRESKLSVDYSQTKTIRAGDRLPYIQFFDEKLAKQVDLHSWCFKTGFTLIVLGKLNERDLFLLAKWIKQTYPFNLNFYYLPPSDKNKHVFDFFEISEKQKKAIIVRPDLHIGYLNDVVVIELIDSYLKGVVGFK